MSSEEHIQEVSFLDHLNQRGVSTSLGAYAVGCFVILQIADATFEPLGIPDWVVGCVITAAILGFPMVAYVAWTYDLSLSEGVRRAKPANRPRRTAESMLVLVYLCVASVSIYYVWSNSDQEAGHRERVAIAGDFPTLAVMPFRTIGELPNDFFVDGMTDDLITDLSQLSQLFVVARNSVFSVAQEGLSPQELGQRLGVRFILEGSVRLMGDNLRINAQLIDSLSGESMWARRYEEPSERSLYLQDTVTTAVVNALALEITPREEDALHYLPTQNVQAHSEFQRGWALYRANTPEAYRQALVHFDRAIELDRDYAEAYAGKAAVLQSTLVRDFTVRIGEWTRTLALKPDDVMRGVLDNLNKAGERSSTLSKQVESRLSLWRGNYSEAIEQASDAISSAPNDPLGYAARSAAYSLAGQPEQGLADIDQAIKLDPGAIGEYLFWQGFAHFGLKQYERAAEQLTLAQQLNPSDDRILIVLASVEGYLGNFDNAQTILARLDALQDARSRERATQAPGDIIVGVDVQLEGRYTLTEVDLWPFKQTRDREHLREGLTLAGLQDMGPEDNAIPVSIEGAQTVSVDEAFSLYEKGVTFVDVRGLSDRNIGYIPNSLFLNLQTMLSKRALANAATPDQKVLFHCEGMR
ncbi:MAG: hypothetical protein AAF541_22965 [Pseudomonadota bacterium]